jgi:hypothetical protein
MKIGVITFWNSQDNYGQLLQCYAMQEYLKKLGHQPFLIRYQDKENVDPTGFKFKKLLVYLLKLPAYIKWYVERRKEQARNEAYQKKEAVNQRNFGRFLSERIAYTEVYTADTIEVNPPHADVYICGSDQIWAGDDAYYLSFAPNDSIKIAYAPSFGGLTSFSAEKESQMKKLIGRLDKVGMREQSGVEICHSLGIEKAVKVVDPTLLLNADDYRKIEKTPKDDTPYAFVYLLGNPIKTDVSEIAEYVNRKGLRMIYVASQGRVDKFEKCSPSIEEWLGLMNHAEVVITNSFHCVVFALQFNRKFISIPLTGGYSRMNTRIDELLDESNLQSAILKENILEYHNESLDFSGFEAYKEKQQMFTKKFLDL